MSNGPSIELLQMMFGTNNRHEPSFEERLQTSVENLSPTLKDSVALNDAYGNKVLSVGTDDKIEAFNNYTFSNDTLNYLLWMTLYNDSWVFKRAIDKPAQDEIRCGIDIQSKDNTSKIQKELKKFRTDLIQLLQWGALFGGSVAIMMFDNFNDKDYSKKLNKEKVKQAKVMKLYVTDRWFGCAPTYSDTVSSMKSMDYGKPMYYDITFADGKSMRVHHDYVLRYEHRTAPKLVKTGQLQGWGYAEGAHILNELARDDKLKSSIQSLIDKSLIEVIKMPGMRGIFMGADSDNEQQIKKRLEMVNWGRNYNSLTFLDTDDDYTMNTFSGMGGLSDLLEQNMWQISAALEMQGVLFGDLKQGFSNDTDALERYSETIQGRCESYVRPIYEKLLSILAIRFDINEKIEFEFNSLIREKQDEKRVEGLQNFVNLCSTLLNDGIISPKQFAKSLMQYSSKGIVNFEFTDEELNDLDDKVKEEMEGIDLDDPSQFSNEKEESTL